MIFSIFFKISRYFSTLLQTLWHGRKPCGKGTLWFIFFIRCSSCLLIAWWWLCAHSHVTRVAACSLHRGCPCRILAVRASSVCYLADRWRHLLYVVDNAHVYDLVGPLRGTASASHRPSSSSLGRWSLDPYRVRLDAVVRHRQPSDRHQSSSSRRPAQRRPTVLHRLRAVLGVRLVGGLLLSSGSHARDVRADD